MRFETRLLVCRAGFVVFCLLPTMVVGAWIIWRSSAPAAFDKAQWERELTTYLGLVAEIGQIECPRPGLTRLGGLRLLEPDTGIIVAEVHQVDVTETAGGWQIAPAQLFIDGNQLALVSRTIDERILRLPITAASGWQAIHVSIEPHDGLIRLSGSDQTLQQLGGEVELLSNSARFELSFGFPSAAHAAGLVRLSAIRDRTESRGRTLWHLNTNGAAIPCHLLASLTPDLAALGRDCQFTGVAQLCRSQGETAGLVVGTLTQVDLDALVSEQFSHVLSGLAKVRIDKGLIERSKLVELRGEVEAQSGAISRSLVTAAIGHLGLVASPESGQGTAAIIPFRRLAMSFHLSGKSLALAGGADPVTGGALLANAAGPILTAPADHSIAAVNLLRTLLPENEYQVPATRQTAGLVQLLPAPDIVSTKAAHAAAHTPARLAPASRDPLPTAVRQPLLR